MATLQPLKIYFFQSSPPKVFFNVCLLALLAQSPISLPMLQGSPLPNPLNEQLLFSDAYRDTAPDPNL
jgi:hypothetical protein